MQETWVESLGLEYPLEKGMAAYSSIFAWRIPWTEEPGPIVHGLTESDMIERLTNIHNYKIYCKKLMLLNCGVGERLLRVPWTARRSNLSILKEIGPEYSLEGLMLKLKLPILWPPDVKD